MLSPTNSDVTGGSAAVEELLQLISCLGVP